MITKESRLPISAQKHVLRIAFVCALYSGCLLKTVSAQPLIRDDDKGLKDYYKAYFPIGAAVSIRSLKGDEANLILREFNSITPENDMKMGPIHPREDFYNWRNADSIVDFAIKHHIRIRGHNLLWHAQAPAWMFKDSTGGQVSKEVLLKRLRDHITTVVNHYKGKIYAWDVVNEAIDDNPGNYLRNSLWYKICGEDFINKAFEYAHAADPSAALYYNDYNSEDESKREKIYKLLKSLVDTKIHITGVGLQGHWKLDNPSADLIKKALDRFSSLGLKIQITELDITVRGYSHAASAEGDAPGERRSADSGLTPALAELQAIRFKEIFSIFRSYKNVITNVTFWNVSDRYSWLDSRNGGLFGGAVSNDQGRQVSLKAYPLLFGENLQRKKAYWSVVNF